jgi:hypothetical protein
MLPNPGADDMKDNSMTDQPAPTLRRGTDMKAPERVNWLLAPNYLVAGRVGLLVGEEGIGKSMWTIQALAAVTTGQAWGPFIASTPRDAIIIATEDGWTDTVAPRLHVAGADLNRVHVFSERDDGEGSPLPCAHAATSILRGHETCSRSGGFVD